MSEPAALWEAANNGTTGKRGGKRVWFLIASNEALPVEQRYHFDRQGRLVRYGSYVGANRAAERLNASAETHPGASKA